MLQVRVYDTMDWVGTHSIDPTKIDWLAWSISRQ